MMVKFPFVCVFETALPINEPLSVYTPSTSLCYFSQYHLAKLNLTHNDDDDGTTDDDGKVCLFETALLTNESVSVYTSSTYK